MPYTPSMWRIQKYGKYFMYLSESLTRLDFGSIRDSLKYVLFKKLPNKNRIIETKMGTFRLRKNTTDFQFVNWTYERALKKHISSISDQIGLFVDIGACIGEYCIWLAGRDIKCLAIEPVNWNAIQENMLYNDIPEQNIFIFNCAVGKENKKVAFHVLEGVTSSSYINETDEGDIDCRRIDDLVPEFVNHKKITFVKLDVEGMELEALEGAKRFITETPNLQIAYEHTSVGDAKIRCFLDRYGAFQYRELDSVNTLAIKKQPI